MAGHAGPARQGDVSAPWRLRQPCTVSRATSRDAALLEGGLHLTTQGTGRGLPKRAMVTLLPQRQLGQCGFQLQPQSQLSHGRNHVSSSPRCGVSVPERMSSWGLWLSALVWPGPLPVPRGLAP